MTSFALILAFVLLFLQAVEWIAQILNLQAIRRPIPDDLKQLYDEAKYAKTQDYARARTRLSLASSAFDLAILFLFWFAGGFGLLDESLRRAIDSDLWRGLVFMGLLFMGHEIFTLPFSLYSTFVVEEKFGFNRTTPKTFVLDRLKAYFLAALLGGPLLMGVMLFFQKAGPWAWVYAWAGVCLFTFALQFIAPNWIMPLFNKFSPLAEGELRAAIFHYAGSVDFPLKNVFVIDGSKRSAKTNAFFTGFGKNKRIALFDTLVARHSVAELVSVMAHEIGHYKMKHVLTGMILSVLQFGLLFFLLSLFLGRPELMAAFHVNQPSVYIGLLLFGVVYTPLSFLMAVGMNMVSRRNEFQADRYAVDTAPAPESLLDALKKLSLDNLSPLTPHPFHVFLTYSHPPLMERLAEIRKRLPRDS